MLIKNNPLISVVMSVYNGEAFLEEAINSVLNQSLTNFEFIIINDGSTDSSLKIIKSFTDSRIKIINQKNLGLSKALNKGIKEANGKFIARMDSDDISLPLRFEKQIDFLNKNPNCVLVGTNAHIIDLKGNLLYTTKLAENWTDIKKILPENTFFHSATMFPKSVWARSGGYREDIIHHFEDKILWNNFSKFGELYNLSDALLCYRLVPTSVSNHNSKTIQLLKEISNRIILTDKVTDKDIFTLKTTSQVNIRNKLGNYYLRLGTIYLENNFNRTNAIINFLKCIRYSPLLPSAYFNLFLALLPKKNIWQWKNWRKSSLKN